MKYFYRLGLFLGLMVQVLLRPAAAVAAPFTPGNIVIVRVGDGTAAPTAASTAVFLDEYTPGGTLVQSVAMPTAVVGNNRALTASGSSTAELALARTANGQALVLAGYGAVPGVSAIANTSSADYVRVVGLVSADGSVNTATSLGAGFSGTATVGSAARSVASADGSSFYVVGTGSPSNVQYVTVNGFNPTAITSTSITSRIIRIADGNLYLSTSSSPYNGISQVGTGLPTTAGQSVTLLPGFGGTATTASPYGFYFADLSSTVPGVDVVYIADDRGATGGIQKWSLVGGNWTLNGTIASTSTATVRGLDGNTVGTTVSLVATSPTGLFVLSDNSGYNMAPTLASLPAAIITNPTNSFFRGVAFAPVAPAAAVPTITSFTPTSGLADGTTTVTVTGTGFTGATAVTLNGVVITGFTVVNSTTITFVVPAGATSGPIAITTPGGTATSTGTFTVTTPNAAPTISSLSPSTAVAGSAGFTLTVNGTNFVSGTVINFNGTALTTTFVSAAQVSAMVPAAALATAGAYPVTATNPAPGGGTSAAVNFTVTAPAPTITSFTPTSGPVSTGTAPTTVTITGTGFTGATAVTLNGVAITAFTVVNSTTITFNVPTGSTSGVIAVTTPSGTATSTTAFVITPAITALSPSAQVVGGPALTLTITGTNFTTASTVNFNNVSYTPTSATATTVVVTIPASVLSTVGAYPVSVTTAGGTSNVFTFTVSNASTAGAYENFEAGTKTSYTAGTVTLTSGVWNFANALLGDAFADKYNGLKSARLRTGGVITMNFDKPNGAGTVIINAALYGTDTGASFLLEQSTDGGTTFTTVAGAPATLTGTLTPYTFTVNTGGNVRFRISNTVTTTTNTFPRINIDDISISNFTAAPTITSFTPTTGGPSTVVTLTGTNLTGATAVRIGTFAITNFTVVNATTITLTLPTGTGSVNGFISVTTPGGTATSATTFNLVSATLAANALPGLSVFPNPATDRLTVELPTAAPAIVALRDLTGRLVLAPAALGADHLLRLPASLASGVYLLEVRQGTEVAIRRIEKN